MSEFVAGQIIVPIDFSNESLAAIDVAIEIASDVSDVTVVHVSPNHHQQDHLLSAVDRAKRRDVTERTLKPCLDDPRHRPINVNVLFGDPTHRIVKVAELRHAKLIVMPSHGRTGFKRLLIGSVAEGVVRLANCPVLVLRPLCSGRRSHDT